MGTTVIIAEHLSLIRHALRYGMVGDGDIEVVAEATTGLEATEKAAELRPDVVVLNCLLPDQDGATVTRIIRETTPSVQVLAFSRSAGREEYGTALAMAQAGAIGYFTLDAERAELVECVRKVAAGQMAFSREVTSHLVDALSQRVEQSGSKDSGGGGQRSLTQREGDVLRHICQGTPNKEIAAKMQVSENSVRSHVRSLLQKLDLDNRTQLAIHGLRTGYGDPNPE